MLRRFNGVQPVVDIERTSISNQHLFKTIHSNEGKIQAYAENVTPLAATKLTHNRSSIMENMERFLNIWLEDLHQRDCDRIFDHTNSSIAKIHGGIYLSLRST